MTMKKLVEHVKTKYRTFKPREGTETLRACTAELYYNTV